MFNGYGGREKKVSKVEYNHFAGKYDKESILGRLATLEGTTMGDIVSQALNEIGLGLAELENIDFTESQARNIASLLGDIHLAFDVEDMESVRARAKELAKHISLLDVV
jgi:hypothetical protein